MHICDRYLLGEVMSKWVGVSSQRFGRIETTRLPGATITSSAAMTVQPTATVWMRGAAGENVTVAWLPPASNAGLPAGTASAHVLQHTCQLGESGEAAMRVSKNVAADRRPAGEWHVECG